ncbi:hypothetical protein B0I22_1450 [Epilithonimonas xixisoli]|uniref:Uncharacterized protein n=1 Tax=Epilithonimonas xixisoli TaxID=1476462 RepID=A0A4R8IAU9_9FLAO|nr:hypothetical protein B0I22_1450 [Epilithonimonas xixisoli]
MFRYQIPKVIFEKVMNMKKYQTYEKHLKPAEQKTIYQP